MRAAVILWQREDWQEVARKAASALGALAGWEKEIWFAGKEEMGDLPFDRILFIDGLGDVYENTEQYIWDLTERIHSRNVDLAVFPWGEKGEELAARIALRLGSDSGLKVSAIRQEGETLIFDRMVYSCNLVGTFRAPLGPFAITLDRNFYEPSEAMGRPEIVEVETESRSTRQFDSYEALRLPEKDSLEDAKRLIVAGRGCGTKGVIEKMKCLGNVMGAKLGATRPVAVDSLLPYSSMIGMTGSITKPELCLAVGASGSTPFMYGVKDSKILAAVNTNAEAPIFRQCDYAVVEDAEAFIEAFLHILEGNE